MEIKVENSENVRLDAYIASKQSDLSRSNIQKLIDSGDILVNNSIKKMSYKVQEGVFHIYSV